MLRNTAMDIVKSRLGNIQGTAHDQLIINNMILAQTTTLEGAHFKPWFLFKVDQTIATASGTRAYSPPTGFLREEEEVLDDDTYDPDNTDFLFLPKKSFQYLAAIYGVTTGEPQAYSFRGKQVNIFPMPDAVYTIVVRGYYRDTELTSNIENEWLEWAPDWVIAETARLTALDLQYTKILPVLESEVARAQARLYTEHVAREEAGQNRIKGEN